MGSAAYRKPQSATGSAAVGSEKVGSEAWEQARLDAVMGLDLLDTPPEPEFDRVARLIKNIFGVSIAIVSVIDAHRQWYKACIGMPVDEVPRSESFCTITIREAEPVIAPDATKDPRFANSPYVTGEPHVRFYAGVPMRTTQGLPIGTLCAIDFEPREFGKRDVEILTDLAAVVMAELELRQMAATDVLTGAMSRRAFREDGANAVALSRRHDTPLSCIALDLDHFKRINDTYGHAAGDKVLVAASNAIRDRLRFSDRVARIGGEEFAILLPHTGMPHALEVAEMLRARIEATKIDVGAARIGITASFGVSELDGTTTSVDALLAQADTALYEAKGSGRNRCVAWQGAGDKPVRRKLLKAGRIEADGKALDCSIRGVSEAGASLVVSDASAIPASFSLSIQGEASKRDARVVERSSRTLEVSFH